MLAVDVGLSGVPPSSKNSTNWSAARVEATAVFGAFLSALRCSSQHRIGSVSVAKAHHSGGWSGRSLLPVIAVLVIAGRVSLDGIGNYHAAKRPPR